MSKLLRSVIIGPPGSGKGTIALQLRKLFNITHVSIGDQILMHVRYRTPLGDELKPYIMSGGLVPDEIINKIAEEQLKHVVDKNWILEGYPCNTTQAKILLDTQNMDLVLHVEIPYDILIERIRNRWIHIKSGRIYNEQFNIPKIYCRDDITSEYLMRREDDYLPTVFKKFISYETDVRPILNVFEKRGILRQVEGMTTDDVLPKVMKIVREHIPKKSEAKKMKNV